MKKVIKEILKNKTYKHYGIRGMEEVEIGEILDTSYEWDFDNDESTYGTDNEMDLGGVSVTIVKENIENESGPYWDFGLDFETVEEQVEGILKAIEWHRNNYSYSNVYLVGSNELGSGSTNDPNEYIFVDAEVLLKVK